MPQASNLQKLAGRPPDYTRRGVTDFIEANEDVIRAAQLRGHSWTVIFEDAVKDGCPTISVRYFTRAAKSVLGLKTGEDNFSLSDKARRAGADTVPQRLPKNEQAQSRKIASAATTSSSDPTKQSPPIEQLQIAVEKDSAHEVGHKNGSDSVDSPQRNISARETPNLPGASGFGVMAAQADAGRVDATEVQTRQPSAPRNSEPGTSSWDSAAPGKRAMLLKDAE